MRSATLRHVSARLLPALLLASGMALRARVARADEKTAPTLGEPPASPSGPPPAPPKADLPAVSPREESLTHPGVSFRPGNGLHVQTRDGDYALNLWLRSDLRYTMLNPPDAPAINEIELRRAALYMTGNLFGPHNKYFVQLAFSPKDMAYRDGAIHHTPIFDWFFLFDHLRDLSVRVGQYKPFFSRQFISGWGDLAFVDRSIVEQEFLHDRDVGFDLHSVDFLGKGRMRYYAGIYAGQGRDATRFAFDELAYFARFEVLPLGLFDDYRELDLERHASPKLAVGAAYGYQQNARLDQGVRGNAPVDGGATNLQSVTADATFKLRGFSALAEFFWRDGQRSPDGAFDMTGAPLPVTPGRNGIGFFAEAGYVTPRVPIGVTLRYGRVWGVGSTSLPDQSELAAGLGYFFDKHNYKVQMDYTRLYPGNRIQDGSDQVRVQIQLTL